MFGTQIGDPVTTTVTTSPKADLTVGAPLKVNLVSVEIFTPLTIRSCLERGSRSDWINLSTKHESNVTSQDLSEKNVKIGSVTAKMEPIHHPNLSWFIRVIYDSNHTDLQNCISYFPITESCCASKKFELRSSVFSGSGTVDFEHLTFFFSSFGIRYI